MTLEKLKTTLEKTLGHLEESLLLDCVYDCPAELNAYFRPKFSVPGGQNKMRGKQFDVAKSKSYIRVYIQAGSSIKSKIPSDANVHAAFES